MALTKDGSIESRPFDSGSGRYQEVLSGRGNNAPRDQYQHPDVYDYFAPERVASSRNASTSTVQISERGVRGRSNSRYLSAEQVEKINQRNLAKLPRPDGSRRRGLRLPFFNR